MSPDNGWSSLHKAIALVYLEYGQTRTTLMGTRFEVRDGPPVAIRLNLERFQAVVDDAGAPHDQPTAVQLAPCADVRR